MTPSQDSTGVLLSWEENARPWIEAVRQRKIASRALVTDQAIIDAVLASGPVTALDLGCGEGWLSWRLAHADIAVTGTDAIASLVHAARQMSGEKPARLPRFLHMSYEELPGSLSAASFDAIVCNFSLLDKEGVEALLAKAPELLAPAGRLFIQTLHPDTMAREQNGQDGWRQESWQGMGNGFRGAAPWYYRTLGSWHALFARCGLHLLGTQEPLHPHTGKPASILFTLGSARQVSPPGSSSAVTGCGTTR